MYDESWRKQNSLNKNPKVMKRITLKYLLITRGHQHGLRTQIKVIDFSVTDQILALESINMNFKSAYVL